MSISTAEVRRLLYDVHFENSHNEIICLLFCYFENYIFIICPDSVDKINFLIDYSKKTITNERVVHEERNKSTTMTTENWKIYSYNVNILDQWFPKWGPRKCFRGFADTFKKK